MNDSKEEISTKRIVYLSIILFILPIISSFLLVTSINELNFDHTIANYLFPVLYLAIAFVFIKRITKSISVFISALLLYSIVSWFLYAFCGFYWSALLYEIYL
ncbi:MAG: hypothetical protein ED557_10635 [Balneola sp.]|nr:MAG: hypothetical protein ED557_10635 [Balneola sp.]